MQHLLARAGAQQVVQPDGFAKLMHIVADFYSTGIDEHIFVFLLFLAIFADIFLGAAVAWVRKKFSSYRFKKGIVSHAFAFFAVAILYPFAIAMNFGEPTNMFIGYLLLSYTASILKNATLVGFKYPKWVDKYIQERIDSYKNETDFEVHDQKKKDKGEKS